MSKVRAGDVFKADSPMTDIQKMIYKYMDEILHWRMIHVESLILKTNYVAEKCHSIICIQNHGFPDSDPGDQCEIIAILKNVEYDELMNSGNPYPFPFETLKKFPHIYMNLSKQTIISEDFRTCDRR